MLKKSMLGGALLIASMMSMSAQGPGGQGGFPGGPPGPGGFGRGGPMGEEQKLVKQFDKNKDDRLDAAERKAARGWLAENGGRRGGGSDGAGVEWNRRLQDASSRRRTCALTAMSLFTI